MTLSLDTSRLAPLPLWAVTLACASSVFAMPVAAQISPDAPPGLENVGVEEHLDRRIPTDLVFRNHEGERVVLADLLDGERPVLLNFVYHSCPSFCSLVLDATLATLRQQAWSVGEEFDVISVSIDPRDTPEVAADARRRLLYNYARPSAERGWHFLVAETTVPDEDIIEQMGANPAAERLADAVGFRYQWVPRQRQYAHAGVLLMLTPEARVARYLYGLEYNPNDVRLGLLEASEGRSITTVERAILYCYRYDSEAQGYTLIAWRVMQIGGSLTALLLFGFLSLLWWRERRTPARSPSPGVSAAAHAAAAPVRS